MLQMGIRIVLVIACLGWLLTARAAFSYSAAQAPPDANLPPGAGREKVIAFCADCHGVEVIASQPRTRSHWRSLITDMALCGGRATGEDIEIIIDYAFTHFGIINVNVADERDLRHALQLTPAEAAALIDYRRKNGKFRKLEDMRRVKGLDFAKVAERKARVVFSGDN
jgi:competence protein ComEA